MTGYFGIYFLTVTCLLGFATGKEKVHVKATNNDVEYAADALARQLSTLYFTSLEPPNRFEVKEILGVRVTPYLKKNFKIYTLYVIFGAKYAYNTNVFTHPPLFITCAQARVKESSKGYYSILSASCAEQFS